MRATKIDQYARLPLFKIRASLGKQSPGAMIWLDTVPESEFDEAGTTKEFVTNWIDVTESMVAEKLVTVRPPRAKTAANEPARHNGLSRRRAHE